MNALDWAVTQLEERAAALERLPADPATGRWWGISAGVGGYFISVVIFCFWLQNQVAASPAL